MNVADLRGSTPGAVDPQHPYPGLKAFTEADTAFFYGRKAEEMELFRMVKRLVLTTCFGASGLGKTSLLNAGLFPLLREGRYFPILVRLNFSPASGGLTTQVLLRVSEEAKARSVEPSAAGTGETLWEYFHRVQFFDSANRLLTPVLVLDQFEEIFTLGAGDARVELLIQELADLVENRIPISKQEEYASSEDPPPFSLDRQHYRVVLSLREDYLPFLEDFLPFMPSLARNRFRLTAMDGSQALDAILQPGKEIVTEDVALEILRIACGRRSTEGIPDLRPALARLRVEPTLLSLFCHELNNRRTAAGSASITLDLLRGSSDQIVSDFYERCLRDRNRAVRAFVESCLLTGSGFRRAEAIEDAIRLPGVTRGDIDELVDRRLLRTETRLEIPHVELIHDVLTKVVRESRDLRLRDETRRRFRRRLALGVSVGVAAILGLGFWGIKTQQFATLAQNAAAHEKELAILAQQTARQNEELVTLLAKSRADTQGASIPPAPVPTQSQPELQAICLKYNLCGYTRKKWRDEFLLDTSSGTWHVFVMSLTSASENQAEAAKKEFQRRFPDQDFAVVETANIDAGNHLYAIVVAKGLQDVGLANRIVGFARESGIEKAAFKWRQP